jgi:hypothetical protein
MTRLVALVLLPLALAFGQEWVEVRSGPFEILTDAGGRVVGRTVAYCEQLRSALGLALGRPEPIAVWPIRVAVFRDALTRSIYPARMTDGRDAHLGALVANATTRPRCRHRLKMA